VTIGAITQVRVLGGLIGVATAQALLTGRLLADLGPVLPSDKLAALLRSTTAISSFTPEEAAATAQCYGEAFNLQNKVMMGLSAAGLVACLGTWKRNPVEFAEVERRRVENEAETGRDAQA
jgi:hypothetical protein